VADTSGVGTTMLAARGTDLEPRFQGASAAAHLASGAVPLTDDQLGGPVPDARRDVDTESDLGDAARLGLGPATRALLDPATGAPGRYATITVTAHRSPTGEQLVITSRGYRLVLGPEALQDGLRTVNAGQRLHAVTTDREVLAAWL
jgi:2-phospho-L-lactate guanylyltransferase